ncbi:MAG TPA: WalW protein [Gammaproteobacteria bacterium]|nr:WalW protein [Gammaproteobacteria bacterium]
MPRSTTPPPILFVISVDTEEEWDWNGPFPEPEFSARNTENIPRFQAFCEERGIRPTYFVDYAIADDPASAGRLKPMLDRGMCEIGGHLHPWCTPPISEDVSDTANSHAINLPPALVSEKLDNLGRRLEEAFGRRPTSFRSGRWGTNGELLRLLASKGYTLDSSIHPYYADDCFSYHEAPDTPYWPDYADCLGPGTQREIFEIPVTSGFNRPDFPRCNRFHRRLSRPPLQRLRLVGILWKLGILRKIQLSPELAEADDMIRLVDAAIARGHRVIHMYFHSSSLLPGMTPYVRNEADLEHFYAKIAAVFRHLGEVADITPCTLTEAARTIIQDDQPCG